MKVLHTADLHLGQILYQNYDRCDEHEYFFRQLEQWCHQEHPDALLISGDVFDIQQPSNAVKELFNTFFVSLQKQLPRMHIVITAGNHDSASRLHADRAVWTFSNTHLVGLAPATTFGNDGWQDNYIIELDKGFIIAMPYMLGDRSRQLQSILDRVIARNTDGKPVVMMGHLAVTGMDAAGHDFEIGKIKTQDISTLGTGYDYLALGHIHKPQTLGHPEDCMRMDTVFYPSPVVRYSGSALHVSCDETYPHTVSLVEMDHHGGTVAIRQLRIDELRHFCILPEANNTAFADEQEAIKAIETFCKEQKQGYIRLKMDWRNALSSNFNQKIYDMLNAYGNEVRYNPRIIWTGQPDDKNDENDKPTFELAELQQMDNPIEFIEKTKDQYPNLDFSTLREVFREIEEEVKNIKEEEAVKKTKKSKDDNSTDTEQD